MATIMDGKELAERQARTMEGKFGNHVLAAILVGENPQSRLYVEKKGEMAQRLGVRFQLHHLPTTASPDELYFLIRKLNASPQVGGIMLQLPLPIGFKVDEAVNLIEPAKDVDGLTDANINSPTGFLPATAVGILELLRDHKVSITGRRIGLVGFTRLLNVPLAIRLTDLGNEVVVSQNAVRDTRILVQCDILITATGKPGLITADMVKQNAVIVDAGIARDTKGKLTGDVDFIAVSKKASHITPVPGGVGPMTVVSLFQNFRDATSIVASKK